MKEGDLRQGDRIYRYQTGNRGTIVWVINEHVGIRWDSSGEVYGYSAYTDGIQKVSPLELLAEEAE